ncbi:MAG: biotin/lipoyl-containing protein [Bacilli bacterium]|nr:biotin/lipoyl-containing protein [Bacilli bacterium]
MKVYKVKVNGKVYEVELEAVEEKAGSIEAPKAAPGAPSTSFSQEAKNFQAPLSGKLLDIKVNVGDTVKKGQVLCVIEAMKLENAVQSNMDGKILEIKATKGAMVASKDVLFVIG